MIYVEIILAASFVLFLLSSLVSGINEIWALLLNKRGRELRRALRLAFPELDDERMRQFYGHPLISPFKEKPKWDSLRGFFLKIINLFKSRKYNHDFLPSYIDPKLFSKVLSDILVLGTELHVSSSGFNDWDRKLFATLDSLDETNFSAFKTIYAGENGVMDNRIMKIWDELVDKSGEVFISRKKEILEELRSDFRSHLILNDEQKKTVLLDNYLVHSDTEPPTTTDFLARNSDSMSSWMENTTTWFEDYMNRVSGWYKKRSHTNIFWWSVFLVVFFNINLFEFVSDLFENQVLRDYLVQNAVQLHDSDVAPTKLSDTLEPLESLFSFQIPKADELLKSLPGWLTTIFAISLGAPFWYDVLSKSINLRAAGKKEFKE